MLKITSMYERKKMLPLVLTLAYSIMKKRNIAKIINETVCWDPNHCEMSPGDLANLIILSTFMDIRTPLTHLADRFEGIDLDFFLSTPAQSGAINSFNAGRALERIGKADCDTVYEMLALSAIQQAGIPTRRLHADTTTVSFYGEYDFDASCLSEEEQAELLEIERGYNKDGRPECKQMVVGQIVNEDGIPITERTMDGSTSDTEWNALAIEYLQQIQSRGFQYGIFVADSKLVTHDLAMSMNDPEKRIAFVSRCPANFERKLEGKTIKKAYETGEWQDIGAFQAGKEAAKYQLHSFREEVCGTPMRLLVLESSHLKKKAEEALEKERKKLDDLIKALKKKEFHCEADAEEERKRFGRERPLELYECKYGRNLKVKFENYCLQVGNKLLIRNLNIVFEPNVVNHLLGSNGSGKSSFAKSCIGIYKYKGRIVGNEDVVLLGSSSNIPSAYKLIDIVHILIKNFEKSRVMELYDLLKLSEISNSLSIKKMSDGQKQKIKLLSFLSANPKTIILDEFTTALDKKSSLDVYDFMLRYSKNSGITILNITHNLLDVEYLPGRYYYLGNLRIEQLEAKTDIVNAYMKGGIFDGNKA